MAKQWQTILVSMTLHVVGVTALVAVPLLAFNDFPELTSITHYVPVDMTQPKTPEVTIVSSAAHSPSTLSAIPTEAPATVTAELAERPAMSEVPGVGAPAAVLGAGVAVGEFTVAPPTVMPTEPVRPGGNIRPPERVAYVAPQYPPLALSAHVSGTVIVEAVIGIDGAVRDARILRSIPLLDAAALAAVRLWRYSPTTLNGIAVPVVMTVTVRFDLGGR